MKSSSTGAAQLSDADLYEHFRDRGLTREQAILHIERRRSAAAPAPAMPSEPGPGTAALVGGAQGATSGFADEIIGAMNAISNPNVPLNRAAVDSSIDATRQQFSDARMGHPAAAFAGNVAGSFVNPLNYLLGPLTKGLGPAAKAATYGGVLGGAQGVGEGDTPVERAFGGAAGAVVGTTVGGGLGWIAGKTGSPAKTIWNNLRSAFGRTEATVAKTLATESPATVQSVQEAAHRAYLTKQGFPQDVQDRLMAVWRNGGRLPANPPAQPTVEVPVTSRPGETVTRAVPDPLDTPTFARRPPPNPPIANGGYFAPTPQSNSLVAMGRGETLPYYPRGGAVEQSMAPYPATSAPVAPTPDAVTEKQLPMMLEWLKGAPAGEESARIATLRALGVPLGPTAETDLLQFLGRTPQ